MPNAIVIRLAAALTNWWPLNSDDIVSFIGVIVFAGELAALVFAVQVIGLPSLLAAAAFVGLNFLGLGVELALLAKHRRDMARCRPGDVLL